MSLGIIIIVILLWNDVPSFYTKNYYVYIVYIGQNNPQRYFFLLNM